MKRLLILTTQRSGSTWLKGLIKQSSNICSDDGEFANNDNPTSDLVRCLRALEAQARANGQDAILVKLMYGQLLARPLLLIPLLCKRWRVIHLTRRPTFDAVVSREVFERFVLPARVLGERPVIEPFSVDPRSFAQRLRKVRRAQRLGGALTKLWPWPTSDVDYTGLAERPFATLNQVALDLDIYIEPPSNLHIKTRTNQWRHEDLIVNFSEVSARSAD